ncbi:MAG: damage-inducible protein CinA, partial [Alishewanella sp. 32-51-5]
AKAAGAEVAVAVSGIAGPDGGSAAKPVGTVHFCFEIQGHQVLSQRIFDGDRASVRQQAIDFVLQQLILLLTD